MAQQIRLEIVVDDKGTPSIRAFNEELRDTPAAGKEFSNALDDASKKTNTLKGIIKEERTEMKQRNFVVREGAQAVNQLSETFVGPSGLTKGIQSGLGSFFELDTALKLIGGTAGNSGGVVGKLGNAIGNLAMPISIAIGAFAILKSMVDDFDKELEVSAKKVHDLEVALGILADDSVQKATEAFNKAWEEIGKGPSNLELLGRSAILLGRILADIINFDFSKIPEEQEKMLDDIAKLQADKVAEAGALMTQAEKKQHDDAIKKLADVSQYNEALLKQKQLEAEIAAGPKKLIPETELFFAKQKIALAEDYLTKLKSQGANTQQIVETENRVLEAKKASIPIQEQINVKVKALKDIVGLTSKPLIDNAELIKSIKLLPIMGAQLFQLEQGAKEVHASVMAQITDDIEVYQKTSLDALNVVTSALQASFQAAFTGTDNGAKVFFKSILTGVINLVEGMIIAAEAASIAKAALSFGLTLLSDLPKIAGAFALLEGAKAIVNSFHQGGTVPKAHEGLFINAPPTREFPVLVRGGETIRTEKQEAALKNTGGGITYNININAPMSDEKFVANAIVKRLKKMGIANLGGVYTNEALLGRA